MNSALLREMAVIALRGNTLAEHRVYSPRDWATREDSYPLILVQTVHEQKFSRGRNSPQFDTVTTLQIAARLEEFDGEQFDDGAMKAQLNLERVKEEIERAVINSYEITRRIQQFKHVRSQLSLTPEGEGHFGQLIIEMDIEYFQGPDDFYPIGGDELEELYLEIAMPDGTTRPGLDITFPPQPPAQPTPDPEPGE
ncbi:hypothetical protein M942_08630 [Enterobacter ludwigii]|jgi:hypothetical protein|uniref:hypothetical protein n=1 Tax=Enterobacter ludwigii TaxID=299767 RepID=UPI0003D85F79|nr:hypothetical protein [Enterobacter ludwigii]AHE72791.1 hypothetical protein M942_08630 [Enterobacter ludwigii]